MKIYVHQIPYQGQTYSVTKEDNWLLEEIERVLECTLQHCEAEITLQNFNNQVRAKGSVCVTIQMYCDLCAEEIELSLVDEVNLLYLSSNTPNPDLVPKNKRELDKINQMISLEEEQLDAGWFYDGVIDLGVVITEHLLILKQNIVQCKDDNVRRVKEGSCRQYPTEGSKNTYNPFAGLDI
jgi:hypothetical protein